MRQCLAAPPTTLAFVSTGPAGIRDTLRRMARMVRTYRRDPTIRQLAVEVRQAANVPSRDYRGEARALWAFVKRYITYVRDVRTVETLQTPLRCLENRAGDCDCQAMLLASLLEAIGHKTRFVAIDYGGPDLHVMAETKLGDAWVPLETTIEKPWGWSPPNQRGRMVETV